MAWASITGIEARQGHDVGGEQIRERHRDRRDAGAQLDAQPRGIAERSASERARASTRDTPGRRPRASAFARAGGVDLEAVETVYLDVGDLR
jgi:hypothetical protein